MKKRTGIILMIATTGFITAPILVKETGLRVNTSESAPVGLWVASHQWDGGIKRGSLVSICPPDMPVVRALIEIRPLYRGNCNVGSTDLLKPIAALPGDTVILGSGNVTVNGRELPNTAARLQEIAFAKGKYIVKDDEVWVFSTYSQDSFDSRYFGPIPKVNIRGIASPVLVNGDPKDMIRGFQ